MKLTTIILTSALGIGAWANEPLPAGAPRVTVCVSLERDFVTNYRARLLVSDIFAGIGVRLEWLTKTCSAPDAIRVNFSHRTPESHLRGALGSAQPFGTKIVVFQDRLPKMTTSIRPEKVLAWVLVHEICHVLQAMVRHSETGIMKAHWTNEDLSELDFKGPHFALEDVRLIQDGIVARTAKSTGKSSAVVAVR